VRPRYSLVKTLDRIRPGTAVGAPKSELKVSRTSPLERAPAQHTYRFVCQSVSGWQLGESPAGCHVCTGCVWCGWNRLRQLACERGLLCVLVITR
jgi:hypothetical protein